MNCGVVFDLQIEDKEKLKLQSYISFIPIGCSH